MTREEAVKAWDKWMEYGYSHSAMPNSMALVMAYNAISGPTREQLDVVINSLKLRLENNEENGVVYIPKFAVEKMIEQLEAKS